MKKKPIWVRLKNKIYNFFRSYYKIPSIMGFNCGSCFEEENGYCSYGGQLSDRKFWCKHYKG